MKFKSLLLLFVLFCLACNTEKEGKSDSADQVAVKEIPFDKTKWEVKEGNDYTYRDLMLNDIVSNDTIRELNREEILEFLGEPSYYRDNENFLYYRITEKKFGLWTLHTKTLVIKIAEDNTIEWMKIHE